MRNHQGLGKFSLSLEMAVVRSFMVMSERIPVTGVGKVYMEAFYLDVVI